MVRGEVGIQLSGLSKQDIHVAKRQKPAARQWDRDQTSRDGEKGGGQDCMGSMPSPAGQGR